MGNKRKWYSILLVGLTLLLASSVTSCAPAIAPPDTTIPPPSFAPPPIPEPVTIPEPITEPVTIPEPITEPVSKTMPELEPQAELVEAEVIRAIDGDTIEVEIDDSSYRVRYIGINTPEVGQPCADEATEKNRELVEGKVVWLEKDVSETDKYDRLLRYVYVYIERIVDLGIDISQYGTSLEECRRLAADLNKAEAKTKSDYIFVNAELVHLGYAQVSTYPPDVKYQDLFLQLEREARAEERGCWQKGEEDKPLAKSDVSEFFIEVISLTSPVSPGNYATIEVQTLPNELLAIEVYYKSGKSEAKGLVPKRADDDGHVWWTWKVGTRTTPGRWKIVIASLNMDWWFKGYENITETVYFEVK